MTLRKSYEDKNYERQKFFFLLKSRKSFLKLQLLQCMIN